MQNMTLRWHALYLPVMPVMPTSKTRLLDQASSFVRLADALEPVLRWAAMQPRTTARGCPRHGPLRQRIEGDIILAPSVSSSSNRCIVCDHGESFLNDK